MSLFRKQPHTAAPTTAPDSDTVHREQPPKPTATPMEPTLFDGANIDIGSIYRSAQLSADELDRVARAEQLLHHVPRKTSQTREIVEATFRAFDVDQTKILAAARKQLDALEAFVGYSHDQTHRLLEANAKRIAELEAEIERCRNSASQATHEGEERARTVNTELLKVQSVLEFFGGEASTNIDEATIVNKTRRDEPDGDKSLSGSSAPPPLPGTRAQPSTL